MQMPYTFDAVQQHVEKFHDPGTIARFEITWTILGKNKKMQEHWTKKGLNTDGQYPQWLNCNIPATRQRWKMGIESDMTFGDSMLKMLEDEIQGWTRFFSSSQRKIVSALEKIMKRDTHAEPGLYDLPLSIAPENPKFWIMNFSIWDLMVKTVLKAEQEKALARVGQAFTAKGWDAFKDYFKDEVWYARVWEIYEFICVAENHTYPELFDERFAVDQFFADD